MWNKVVNSITSLWSDEEIEEEIKEDTKKIIKVYTIDDVYTDYDNKKQYNNSDVKSIYNDYQGTYFKDDYIKNPRLNISDLDTTNT
ncbi:MAG: hypothetical protein U9Q66_02505 [Patescibacteria group bacterium]|nr:hypothetical protein [Patescibacteria group bacterium]